MQMIKLLLISYITSLCAQNGANIHSPDRRASSPAHQRFLIFFRSTDDDRGSFTPPPFDAVVNNLGINRQFAYAERE